MRPRRVILLQKYTSVTILIMPAGRHWGELKNLPHSCSCERIFPFSLTRLFPVAYLGRKIIPMVANRQNKGKNKTANRNT